MEGGRRQNKDENRSPNLAEAEDTTRAVAPHSNKPKFGIFPSKAAFSSGAHSETPQPRQQTFGIFSGIEPRGPTSATAGPKFGLRFGQPGSRMTYSGAQPAQPGSLVTRYTLFRLGSAHQKVPLTLTCIF